MRCTSTGLAWHSLIDPSGGLSRLAILVCAYPGNACIRIVHAGVWVRQGVTLVRHELPAARCLFLRFRFVLHWHGVSRHGLIVALFA